MVFVWRSQYFGFRMLIFQYAFDGQDSAIEKAANETMLSDWNQQKPYKDMLVEGANKCLFYTAFD
eukprot:15482857-Alexandrium_andersonii.AAC.1